MDVENLIRRLYEKVRLTPDAEAFIKTALENEEINIENLYERIIALDSIFITKEDIETIIADMEKLPEPVEVIRAPGFKPIAKEYEQRVFVYDKKDVSGKSRSTGKAEDFVKLFNNRFQRIKNIFKERKGNSQVPLITVSDIRTISANTKIGERNQLYTLVAMVSEKRTSAKGNLVLNVEDETGTGTVVFMTDEKNVEKAKNIFLDDILMFEGRVGNNLFLAFDAEWPEIPFNKEKKLIEEDLAVVYLSDFHIGSRLFLEDVFDLFVQWLNGNHGDRELAGKVKYIVIAGDIVDGIGIYPTQEQELNIKDIFKQYRTFLQLVENIPDYITLIVGPGNHDAVRRAEPQPKLPDDLLPQGDNIIKIGNPSWVDIEGLKHVVYHGTSLDSVISAGNKLDYAKPELPMIEVLRRRHLSSLYGWNPIVPEHHDYMVIDDVPDVVHMGHIHRNAHAWYRNVLLVNSGTFQAQTDFQIKQGHIPTPGIVAVYELHSGEIKYRNLV